MTGRRRQRLAAAGAVLAVGLLVVIGAAAHRTSGSASLTADVAPYVATPGRASLRVENRTSGPNQREVHWAVSQPDVADSSACATWRSGVDLSQNGIAFRIARRPHGYRAVVLERNVYGSYFTAFKLIYFADGRFDVDPAVVDLTPYLATPDRTAVYPLRVCARLDGSQLAFAVARGEDPMPAPGTPGRGGTFTVHRPVSRGATGVYVAHVPRRSAATVDSMTLDGRPAPTVGR